MPNPGNQEGWPTRDSRRTNPMAIAALVAGLLFFVPFVAPILAIVLGYGARSLIRRSDGRERGAGLAAAGIVLGWILLVLHVVVWGAVAVVGPCIDLGDPTCGAGLGRASLVIAASGVALALIVHVAVEGLPARPLSEMKTRSPAIRAVAAATIGSAVVAATAIGFVSLTSRPTPVLDEFESIKLPEGWVMVAERQRESDVVTREYRVSGGPSHALESLAGALRAQGFEDTKPEAFSGGFPPCGLSLAKNGKELDAIPTASDFTGPTQSDPYGCPTAENVSR